MILVLAHRTDAQARLFVNTFPGGGARLLSSRDLSRAGWRLPTAAFEAGRIVADGQPLPVRAIRGLVSMLPAITPDELLQIAPDDRAYVAAEMNALLAYFLHRLDCPKLNPPALGCFLGCNWRPERWLQAAARSGFRVRPFHRGRQVPPASPAAPVRHLGLVGQQVIGEAPPPVLRAARALARQAGVPCLNLRWEASASGPVFLDAHTLPNTYDPRAREAIYQYFAARQAAA